MERLLDAYERRGYPYAALELRPAWVDPAGMQLLVDVREGPRVVFDDIRVEGNRTTRAHVIRREVGIEPGDVYDARRFERIRPRLLRLGFFEEVTPTVELGEETGRTALVVQVEERRTHTLYGAVGYIPDEPDGYLTGVLDLSFGNIAGTGRTAAVRWRTYRPEAFEWTFAYGEPWLFGAPVGASMELHQEVRDSTFTRTAVELGLDAPIGDRFRAHLAGRTESVTAGSGGEGTVLGSRRRSVDAGFRWDTRDDPLNPRRGTEGDVSVAYGRKHYEEDAAPAVGSVTWRLEAAGFRETARRQVVAVSGSFLWLDTDEIDIPEHEQFRVGGAESLRGYAEDAFFGWRVWTASLEYRFLLGRRSRVHAFLDGANLDRRIPVAGGTEGRAASLLGWGVGLRTASRVGMIGVDFGIARGDPLTEGKIHVRLEGEF